jgi:cellulose synthase/poly-beta-1,6-N-acetylglucosamine synthase-like glycosyltransferase/putative flippase GtrA
MIVGAVSTLFQLALLHVLLLLSSTSAELDNSVAFLLSTQLNFGLSDRFTWAHRVRSRAGRVNGLAVRLLSFNASAALGLLVNASVFSSAHHIMGLPVIVSALAAVGSSTAVSYVLSSRVVFRSSRRPRTSTLIDQSTEVGKSMSGVDHRRISETHGLTQAQGMGADWPTHPLRVPVPPPTYAARPASPVSPLHEPDTEPIPLNGTLPDACTVALPVVGSEPAQGWLPVPEQRASASRHPVPPVYDPRFGPIPPNGALPDACTVALPAVGSGPLPGRLRVPDQRAGTRPGLTRLRPLEFDARVTATAWQRVAAWAALAVLVLIIAAAAVGYNGGLMIVVGAISALYFVDLIFAAYLVTGSIRAKNRPPRPSLQQLPTWPVFTVLCPMYRETTVLPQFVKAIRALDYPADALQVLLLLEEDDTETVDFARAMDLPPSFEIAVVPHSQPKTKPKACNYGLQIARGDYVVIFDAEDVPEPDQLKKAALAFARLPGNVACLQAPLNFYNPRQNVLTRLFTAEYSLWFDLMLAGLQRLNGPIPLGGTSNHFRTDILRGLGGWDPFNVTEDADLGIRLYKQGFRTGMLDSTTYEEANPKPGNWIRQRSRWIKGYMQTLLVHTRGGWDLRRTRDLHFLTFLLIIGGKVAVNFINPLMWAMTIAYFVFRGSIGSEIQALYPPPVFYIAAVTLLVGNMLFIYTFLLGSAHRNNHDLIKYGLLAPIYWLMMSVAACKALWQLVRNPHYWEKTQHGLHLDSTKVAAGHGTPAQGVPARAHARVAPRDEVLVR